MGRGRIRRERSRHGLILGYAETPELAIDPACANLAHVIRASTGR